MTWFREFLCKFECVQEYAKISHIEEVTQHLCAYVDHHIHEP